MNIFIIFAAKYLLIVSGLSYVVFTLFLFQTEKKRFRSFIILSIISFVCTYLFAKILSLVISDPRPFLVSGTKPMIDSALDNGFPSDHMLLAMAIAAVTYLYSKRLGLILFVLALIIGSARVLAGVHHTLDIIGSVAIATTTVAISSRFLFTDDR